MKLKVTPTNKLSDYNPLEQSTKNYCRLTCVVKAEGTNKDFVVPTYWGVYKSRVNFEVINTDGINTHNIAYVLASHNIQKPVHYVPFIYRKLPVIIMK